jgi:hypothetical protein
MIQSVPVPVPVPVPDGVVGGTSKRVIGKGHGYGYGENAKVASKG